MKFLFKNWYFFQIAFFSFCFFSSLRYTLLNSDSAINILMICDYYWPQNMYAWGQNRMGTIIPLLAQPFYQFGLSALWSESIVHYGILVLGCFCFIKFFKNTFFKFLFTLVWFFPISHMIDHTQFAYGIQMSLFGFVIYLCYHVWPFCNTIIKKIGILFSLLLLALISTWVSDMSISLIGLWGGAVIIIGILKHKLEYVKNNVVLLSIFSSLLILTYLLVNWSKVFSTQEYNYYLFASFINIKDNYIVFLTSLISIPLMFLIIPFFTFRSKNNIATASLITGVMLTLFILCFQWTYLNNVPRRYFTPSFILISWGYLLNYDAKYSIINKSTIFKDFYKQKIFYLMLVALIYSFSSLYELKYVSPKTLKPRASFNNEYDALGNIGIIAEYWNAYVNSVTNPKKVAATPHQGCEIKNPSLIDSVFAKPKIFLIKDCWLAEYPDTLMQFNIKLVKNGKPFIKANSNFCEYKVLK